MKFVPTAFRAWTFSNMGGTPMRLTWHGRLARAAAGHVGLDLASRPLIVRRGTGVSPVGLIKTAKSTILLGLVLALAASGYAQPIVPPGQARKPAPAVETPDLATVRANVDHAKNLAKGHHVAEAEAALTALNHARPNTAAWHLETAQRLMQTAEQVARDGQPRSVPALAASALAHLTQAESLARNASERAQAKTLAGFIHERYLANPAAAVASYEAAAQLAPAGATAAKEAAERLRRTDDNVRAKSANGRK